VSALTECNYRKLGDTGLDVSTIGFGTWRQGYWPLSGSEAGIPPATVDQIYTGNPRRLLAWRTSASPTASAVEQGHALSATEGFVHDGLVGEQT